MTQQPTERPEMQPRKQQALTYDISLSCVDAWGRTVEVPTTLGYRTTDPYAVTLTFHSHGVDVEWIVSRTLLLQGLAAPAGEGDVKIYPSIDDDARAVAVLDFSSPDGRLVAQANTHDLHTFLALTFDAVAVGAESRFLDIDGLLAALLTSAE